MVRVQFLFAFLVFTLIAVDVSASEEAEAVEKTPPVATDVVADTDGEANLGIAGMSPSGPCGEDSCPMDAGCSPLGEECCSYWSVEAGAIFLNRNRANARPSAKFYGAGPGQTAPGLIFDMANADIGTAAGYDMTVTRCFGPCWDLEARYFQIGGWNDSQSFNQYTQTYVSAYNTIQTTDSPSYAYSSRLYNIEMNLRWKQFDRIPFLMGFRTLGLDENFRIISNGARDTTWAETSTNNNLYGMQIGIEPVLWDRCGRFRLEGTLKAGLYGNTAHQRTQFPTVGGEWNSRVEGSPSFVGELGLIGSYQLNKCWSIRGGYEVMWITDVALAPDQSSGIFFGAPPIGVMNDKASAFYYGATASLERRF
jgi:hypothetical protein